MPAANAAHLTVGEIADHLRLSPRKVYDLASRKGLPHVRAGGKLLFDVVEVERWLAQPPGSRRAAREPAPPTLGGSHDPLLEWAVRESGCGLALLTGGSTDGLERLVSRQVCGALLHLPAADLGNFNIDEANASLRGRDAALVEWARREQGLLVAPGDAKRIKALADVARRGVRVALRQPGAGSAVLLDRLLAQEGITPRQLKVVATERSENDLALAVRSGHADVGLGARAAAKLFGLAFVPLAVERLDLAVSRAAWFEPPLQALFAFAHSRRFATQARELTGYDIKGLGVVRWNDPG